MNRIAETWPNLVTMFFDQAEQGGNAPFLWAKHDGAYVSQSWAQTAIQVSELARGLKSLGVVAGDRVLLISENRPEWLIADIAIMAAGAITVPGYVTNTEADHRYLIENSGAKAAIVSSVKLFERVLAAALKADSMEDIITIEKPELEQHVGVNLHTWSDVLKTGSGAHESIVSQSESMKRDQTACIIYTSGTGGAPKGVMLHHGAILHNCTGARDALTELGLGEEVFLSFLPLSHSYEHTAGQFFPISIGAQIYYCEADTLAANMVDARPTIMTAVPRLYETLHARITHGVRQQGGAKEKLFNKTVQLGRKKILNGGLGPIDGSLDAILSKLVRKKVQARFGGRLKALVSGGAPLNPDIGLFFQSLGLCILQGYGQTESGPVVSVNRPSNIKMDTVGPAMTDVTVKIADDGEILVQGELVMQGYWMNDKATGECIQDGWLHTGDIGHMDEHARLLITDRKKDIIVNSGGDNIAPQRIEGILTLEPEIAQAMVYGDKRPHLVALLVPDPDWLEQHPQASDEELHKALGPVIEKINAGLSNIERVRRFIIAEGPFTIDNALMTPSMKIRRHKINEIYGERLTALYG
ncbi:MAG: long-chain fatty acid--CoA ligase [Rhodospirillaceae bacterium]|jgi:long-chain acyl-CoA synthetase|nr:long-chain fatty acid--CoA ligase [Rhodospirillaceae bacterium]MBT5245058.1 long-chain fatty acid--CoA ligase [Rhodospirillaceae bacterium]MBT5561441.1 long-chain fatty acid--CoA ligase [Rhodospirillaceae bacterium]MBT6241267.1 long-chain fatty acid--CoA ligase [Rhodospirillaceae bacterium]MBT7137420.1 long-chain fatty acid--CoA ligase [Rhodospirillaceae bacterium]